MIVNHVIVYKMIDYKRTFSCCGKENLLELEKIKILYYRKVHKIINIMSHKEFAKEIFGQDNHNWAKLHAMHYMWNLLELIYKVKRSYQNRFDLGMIDDMPSNIWYIETFNLECIRKKYACIGIDILPLLKLIGLEYEIILNEGILIMN